MARNKADKEHLNKLVELGCCVCLREGFGASPAEVHHIRSRAGAGQRSADMDAIPLCAQHHRTGGYGVAFHAGKKGFESRYGTEEELLAWTMERI
jgi:hypothetical protein